MTTHTELLIRQVMVRGAFGRHVMAGFTSHFKLQMSTVVELRRQSGPHGGYGIFRVAVTLAAHRIVFNIMTIGAGIHRRETQIIVAGAGRYFGVAGAAFYSLVVNMQGVGKDEGGGRWFARAHSGHDRAYRYNRQNQSR